ncbi:signaling lymphocytic activation molecule isoform X1 [Nycticebus coucang]|uniref:signaling lymphocytic activation molecule isoform X1 n=1 Tax=Nycticebus coucang TaxID=9470 RepID=UPI00234E1E04|nr:signaling lymphocytic activation molecule isoform X1 [Nycticebus coucang]
MDLKGLHSLTLLLFLSLAFEPSYGLVTGMMNCPKTLHQLGRKVLLPLTHEGIKKSTNRSIHIVVTVATSPENSVKKKIVSLDPSEGGRPRYLKDRYKFHLENLSLDILESRKEDEGWYFMTLEKNDSVQHFCRQLKLYEQVSTPEIKVLNKTQENGTCTLMLACMVEKGDNVVYSWSEKADSQPLSSVNSSHLLSVTLGPQQADDTYICTVSNPISNHSKAITPWPRCHTEPSGPVPWGLYAGLCFGVVIGAVIILEVVLLLLRRGGKTDHYQPTKEAKSLTIYAQVQKSGALQKKYDPLPAQNPCTTIYVAATEPLPESVQEPNSITVYASVTLPES